MSVLTALVTFFLAWLFAGAAAWGLFVGLGLRFVPSDQAEATSTGAQRVRSSPGP